MPQLLKLLTEFGPLLVFFLTNWYAGIFYATGAFMVATIISLTLSKLYLKKIPFMPLFTGVFVITFGALTLYLQDETFIKIKPTIVNLIFASILLVGYYRERLYLKLVFAEAFQLTEEGWRQLTIRWGIFFIFLALVNEFVWRTYDTDTWINFKVFGIMPITMIFAISQVGLLQRHQIDDTSESDK